MMLCILASLVVVVLAAGPPPTWQRIGLIQGTLHPMPAAPQFTNTLPLRQNHHRHYKKGMIKREIQA